MSLTLFYDCESSGLMRPNLEPGDPSQPRLLQLSYKLVDEQRNRVARLTHLVKPDGWSIEPEARSHHHIDEAIASRAGLPMQRVLQMFLWTVTKAGIIVAHNNHGFDRMLIQSEIVRNRYDITPWASRAKDMRCTMEMAKDIVNLPGLYGDAKFPSLEEAHDFFIPSMAHYVSQHDGETDTEACERIFWAILDRESHASAK